MNLSRAYSLTYGEDLSVGRVQTPTLAMLVERELAIRRFVPEDYLEVLATFHPQGAPADQTYQGTWLRDRGAAGADKESLQQAMRLPADGEEAKRIAARARTGQAAIESIAVADAADAAAAALRSDGTAAPRQPALRLQRAEDARHRAGPVRAAQADQLSAHGQPPPLAGRRADAARRRDGDRGAVPRAPRARDRGAPAGPPLRGRCQGHRPPRDHPDRHRAGPAALSPEERKIYDLICRRLLSAWHEDHIWSVTTVITAIRNEAIVDRYHTSGSAVQQVGLEGAGPGAGEGEEGQAAGEEGRGRGAAAARAARRARRRTSWMWRCCKKKTRAPKRFTEATLLTAMETAGSTLDEKELSDAMKETGLGTPATRAAIIEVLLKREYIVRNGKSLEATDKGIRLIEVVHPEVKSPAMTGQWEAYLQPHPQGRGAARRLHDRDRGVRPRGGREGGGDSGAAEESATARRLPPRLAGAARAGSRRRSVDNGGTTRRAAAFGVRLSRISAPARRRSAGP